MRSAKYLLIGGGLASSQAAKQLRGLDARGAITLAGEEPYVPYDRPPLSKEFLRGEKPREELYFDPEPYFHDHDIELVLGGAVRALNLTDKTATFTNGEAFRFEKALLATGGRPVRLQLPGGDLRNVHYLRTVAAAAAIAAEAGPSTRAVLIGAGFSGMEVAGPLTQRGVQVTVIEAQPHIWARFADATLAGFVQDSRAQKGVTFRTSELVTEIRDHGRPSTVVTRSEKQIACDVVCIGTFSFRSISCSRPHHSGARASALTACWEVLG